MLNRYNAEKAQNKEFRFAEELVSYCEMDVEILRKGCMKYRQLLKDKQGVDPFAVATTIASSCMDCYRRNFLKENTIGIVPAGGYRKNDKQSIIAIKWLKWLSEQNGLDIQHAKNGGEVCLLVVCIICVNVRIFVQVHIRVNGHNYKVDGRSRTDPEHIYEFYGCAFHGCPVCYKDSNRKLPLSDITASEALRNTREREQALEAAGYVITAVWEHEVKQELKENPEMKQFFDDVPIRDPMDPRQAFFGGRTNARKFYHKCTGCERISYVDVCSLYPWVCKYGRFPVGHPKVITENFEPVTTTNQPYHGLISCCVLPPRGLIHPVLPTRVCEKLLFHLCKACAETHNPDECNHTDEQRQFWGAWPTCELYKALEVCFYFYLLYFYGCFGCICFIGCIYFGCYTV